jgi:hypothetical protein
LRGRSKDSEEAIRRRLTTARAEIDAVVAYDYVVVNDELEACVDRIRAIVLAERARPRVMALVIDQIVNSFQSKGSRVNKFEFVIVSGARAKQLLKGCTPKTTGSEKWSVWQ